MTAEMSMNKLVLITAAVVTLLVLSVGIYQYSTASKDPRIDSICKIEVNKANLATKVSDNVGFAKAVCERNEEEVISLSKNKEIAEQELSRYIVNEIDRCYGRMGAGRLNPYPGELLSQKIHCYVCRPFSIETNGDWDELDLQYYSASLDESAPLTVAFNNFGKYDLKQTVVKTGRDNLKLVISNGNEVNANVNEDILPVHLKSASVKNGVFKDVIQGTFSPFRPKVNQEYYIANAFVSDEEWGLLINGVNLLSYTYIVEKEDLLDTCAIVEN